MKWLLKKKKRSSSKILPSGHESVHPVRDWMLGLAVASGIFLIGVSIIVYDFRMQFVVPPEYTGTTSSSVRYNDRDIERYVQQFKERDIRFTTLRGAVPDSIIVSSPELTPTSSTSSKEKTLAPEGADGYTDPAPSS